MAELILQKFTQSEVALILKEETGIRLSQQQISYDLTQVKKEWQKTAQEHYNVMMMQELARIDALESETWRIMRDSVKDKEREVIDMARRKIQKAKDAEATDEEYEMVVTKIQSTIEGMAVNPAYLNVIQDCQKERRKLLGLYAPQKIGVEKTVVVKAYKNVSPDDWDAVIEGELVN